MTRVPVAVNFCDLLTDRGIRVVGKVLRDHIAYQRKSRTVEDDLGADSGNAWR